MAPQMGLIGFYIAQGYKIAYMALLGPFWPVGILLKRYNEVILTLSPRILWGEASESQSVSQSLPQRLLGEGLRHLAWPSEPYWGKPHEASLCPGAPRQSLIPDLVKKLACVPKPYWGKPQETDLVREPSWGSLRRPACVPEPPSEVYRGKPPEFTLGFKALLGESSRGQPVSQSPPALHMPHPAQDRQEALAARRSAIHLTPFHTFPHAGQTRSNCCQEECNSPYRFAQAPPRPEHTIRTCCQEQNRPELEHAARSAIHFTACGL